MNELAKPATVLISDKGDALEINIDKTTKVVQYADINPSYMHREFMRGLKLRIDNAAAGVDDEKKLAAKVDMLDKIDFSHASGGIAGGRKKESAEMFLSRYEGKIDGVEAYQAAALDAQANVRKDELSDVLVELTAQLSETF